MLFPSPNAAVLASLHVLLALSNLYFTPSVPSKPLNIHVIVFFVCHVRSTTSQCTVHTCDVLVILSGLALGEKIDIF